MDQVQSSNDRAVITPSKDIVANTVQDLRAELFEVIQSGEKHVVVDLQHVEIVDSTGLGVLISAQNSVQEQGGGLTVINVSDDILRLFKIMRLDQHFVVQAREAS